MRLFVLLVYDASAKFPTGILSGKSFDFGDYDECLETNTTGLGFEPQYCIVNIRFSPSAKLYPNYYESAPPKLTSTVPVWEAVKVGARGDALRFFQLDGEKGYARMSSIFYRSYVSFLKS